MLSMCGVTPDGIQATLRVRHVGMGSARLGVWSSQLNYHGKAAHFFREVS